MKESIARGFLIIAVALLIGASTIAFSTDISISTNSAISGATSTQISNSYSVSSTGRSQTSSSTRSTESQSSSGSASTASLTSSTIASISTSRPSLNSSITFSSPSAAEQFMPGQNITISGAITPTPKLPDNVLIELSLSGGSDLEARTVALQVDGSFSSTMSIGPSWPVGTYTITASDSYGTTGVATTTVYNQMY